MNNTFLPLSLRWFPLSHIVNQWWSVLVIVIAAESTRTSASVLPTSVPLFTFSVIIAPATDKSDVTNLSYSHFAFILEYWNMADILDPVKERLLEKTR